MVGRDGGGLYHITQRCAGWGQPHPSWVFPHFLQRATFGQLDDKPGLPRALLQVYDNEGTASSSADVLGLVCGLVAEVKPWG